MEIKKIRCYKTFANVYPGVFNYPVYYLVYEGWSKQTLATCKNCGELFVVDWDNPKTKGLSLSQIAGSKCCPKCNSALNFFIENYPQVIRLPDGKIGSFTPDNYIPPDNESLILDVFEIVPELNLLK